MFKAFRNDQAGFTFIELIVVVSIIAILSGAGITTFLNLRDRRAVNSDARLVEQMLRQAQRQALAGEKPSECEGYTLTAYQVRIDQNAAYLSAVCPGVTTPETELLVSGSTLQSSPNVVTFPVVRGGGTSATIDVCQTTGTTNHYRITVTSAGTIEEATLILTPCS